LYKHATKGIKIKNKRSKRVLGIKLGY